MAVAERGGARAKTRRQVGVAVSKHVTESVSAPLQTRGEGQGAKAAKRAHVGLRGAIGYWMTGGKQRVRLCCCLLDQRPATPRFVLNAQVLRHVCACDHM